jgi:hypothetical protein
MNSTPIDVNKFFSETMKQLVADELLKEMLHPDFSRDAVNVDFYIKDGKMRSSKPWNTQFQFDADNLESSKEILHYLANAEEPTQEDISYFESWRIDLSRVVETTLNDEFRSQVRNLVFGENIPEVFPLTKIKVTDIDITNRPENDRVLVVRKDAPQNVQTQPVTAALIKEFEETGKDVNDIIADKKKNDDPKYRWITSATWRKHFYDITVSFMIDYTPNINPSPNNNNS